MAVFMNWLNNIFCYFVAVFVVLYSAIQYFKRMLQFCKSRKKVTRKTETLGSKKMRRRGRERKKTNNKEANKKKERNNKRTK